MRASPLKREIFEDGDLFETVLAYKAIDMTLVPDTCEIQFLTAEIERDSENYYRVIISRKVLGYLHQQIKAYAEVTGQSVEQLLGIE